MKAPLALAVLVLVSLTGCQSGPVQSAWQPLFPQDGVPVDWVVRAWNDVSQPPPATSEWRVEKGVLTSGGERNCWLMWERKFGDFDLEFEFRLGARGNSGLALRAPMAGDPAFDGMELQMADYRYNPEAKDSELTGGIYRALAPWRQVYRPLEWNRYEVSLAGTHLRVKLNHEVIQDVDLATQTATVKRHDGRDASALKDRPRRGHIGFQNLSRDNGNVEIRNARIRIRNTRDPSTYRPLIEKPPGAVGTR